jgi:hypothetical protein
MCKAPGLIASTTKKKRRRRRRKEYQNVYLSWSLSWFKSFNNFSLPLGQSSKPLEQSTRPLEHSCPYSTLFASFPVFFLLTLQAPATLVSAAQFLKHFFSPQSFPWG